MVVSETIVPQNNEHRKNATLLSSVAYFDAEFENTHTDRTTHPLHTSKWNSQHVTPAHNRRKRREDRWKVSIHADMMKITASDKDSAIRPRDTSRRGGKRGAVRGFSSASRKRMIELLTSIRNHGTILFVTLTYPDKFPSGDTAQWDADFEAFRRRFERAFPKYSAVWRMELVERKSGYNKGVTAPHYHLMVFTGHSEDDYEQERRCNEFWAWCSNNWFEIAACEDENHIFRGVDCSLLKSRRHAYAYVSKYTGKRADDNLSVGRRWGRIGRLDTSASETFRMTDGEYIELRRLVKKWLKSRKSPYWRKFVRQSPNAGCTVFGFGDTLQSGETAGDIGGYWQLVTAAKAAERAKEDQHEWERA